MVLPPHFFLKEDSMGIKNITSREDLQALRSRRARRYVTRLKLSKELEVNPKLLARLNRNLGSCGCFTGSIFVFVGLVVGSLWMVHNKSWTSVSAWGEWGGSLLALALFGKFTGLAFAERTIRKTLEQIIEG